MPKKKKQKFSTSDTFCLIASHIRTEDLTLILWWQVTNALYIRIIQTIEEKYQSGWFYRRVNYIKLNFMLIPTCSLLGQKVLVLFTY